MTETQTCARKPRTCGSGNTGIPQTPLAARLKTLRTATGINQKQFAAKLGSSQNRVGDWELGINTPTLPTLQRYADLFEMTVSQLLAGVM